MALHYPNLSAAVADVTLPVWRGSTIGIYRFWRDLGHAIGALGLGLAASLAGHDRRRLPGLRGTGGGEGDGEQAHPALG